MHLPYLSPTMTGSFHYFGIVDSAGDLMWWYHRQMTTATAQAFANIAFIKFIK